MSDFKRTIWSSGLGLLIGFSFFSLAGIVSAGLLYLLTVLAEQLNRGITEAWFWLGIFPVLGALIAGITAFAGWTMIVIRMGWAASSPSVNQFRYIRIEGGFLGLITAYLCTLSRAPLILIFSFEFPLSWLFGIGIAGVQIGAGWGSAYLASRILQKDAPDADRSDGTSPASAYSPLRLAVRMGAAVGGALLTASLCTGLYYLSFQGDLFLNSVYIGLPCAFVAFAVLGFLALLTMK